jgi:VanZ family protein
MRAGRLTFAITVAAGLIVSAPYVGQIRTLIQQTFPGHFVLVVGGLVATLLIAGLWSGLRRVRDRHAIRYGAVVAALVVAALYARQSAGANPNANVVELFHFVQYGLIAYLFYRAWRPLGDLGVLILPALASLIVGTVEEWWQWFIPVRVGEVKDVLLNLVAIGTGLIFSLAVDPPSGEFAHAGTASRRLIRRVGAVAVVVFAAFFHAVHLGHGVDDDEIGTFDSRWTREALLQEQVETAARWQTSPPPVALRRLSRENQYLTEGVQHVRERNRLWEAGDIRGAWLENRILEKYYEPILDTPTHEGPGHRWAPEQRADAEARAALVTDAPYVSAAFPYPLYRWPWWVHWLAALIAAATASGLNLRNPEPRELENLEPPEPPEP